MIGMAVGAGMKVAGALWGAAARRKAYKRMKANIQNQMNENQNWYDRRYNEDGTQRADAQRLFTMTNESVRNRNQQAAGAAAVMGGSTEAVAASKEANNKVISETMSTINQQAEARKDAVEQQYMQTKQGLQNQLNTLEQQGAEAAAQAASQIGAAGNSIAGAFENDTDLFKAK